MARRRRARAGISGLGLIGVCLRASLALLSRVGGKATSSMATKPAVPAPTLTPMVAAAPATPTAVRLAATISLATDTPAPAVATSTPPPAVTATAAAPGDYTVVPGDTLSAIAKELGVDLAALAGYNGIEDASRISVGQVLELPPAEYVPPTPTITNTPEPLPPTDTPEPELLAETSVPEAPAETPAPSPVDAPTAEAAPTPEPTSTPIPAPTPAPVQVCCKHCSSGKACGDTCIARNRTCQQPPGCACNG